MHDLRDIPPLTDLDRDQFRRMTAQESASWEGQAAKTELLQRFIRERISQAASGSGIRKAGKKDADLVMDTFPVKDHKMLLVGKGSGIHELMFPTHSRRGNRIRQDHLNVLVPAHIDTVDPEAPDLLRMRTDPADEDRVMGRGVYDMGAAVLNGVALPSVLDVPEGINVIFAFPYDEERNSEGAKALIEKWQTWKDIDIVLSSEIGHVDVQPGETGMGYIMGRRGRIKYHLNLTVEDNGRGHFADGHVRSASQALGEASYLVDDAFYHNRIINGKKLLSREHPNFHREKLEHGESSTFSSDGVTSSPPETADMFYNIQSVPGRSLEESLAEQQSLLAEIARISNWTGHRIRHHVTQNSQETSYEGYIMPEDHLLPKITADILTQISGGAIPKYGPSVADENLYFSGLHLSSAAGGKSGKKYLPPYRGVMTIPPVGGNAHRLDEWVSWRDIARVRHAMRQLIEHEAGLQKILKVKRRLAT